MKVYKLHIFSWVEVSPGASHFYGDIYKLHEWKKEVSLQHVINESECAYLNREAYSIGVTGLYKPGDEHPGFPTKEKVIEAAIFWAKNNDVDILIEGSTTDGGILHCVYAKDEELQKKINDLRDNDLALYSDDDYPHYDNEKNKKSVQYYKQYMKLIGEGE